MDTGDSKKKQEKKGKGEGRFRWAIQVFFLSVVLSAVLSLASEEALDGAGMALAFVVLYNLNNINISERKRELATLKVLGFFDGEVSSYVNRENILLTLIGTGAGVFLGMALHRFIIVTAEVDMLMFGRMIAGKSYLYSILITFAFSAVVNGVMFFKLRGIDMIESLKSVE